MTVLVAIIDYGMGNVRSVKNALSALGFESVLTNEQEKISQATHVILPGVGAFGDGMRALRERGLDSILEKEVRKKKKPFLGICLGMQLLMEYGEEGGRHDGLGWIEGGVRRFLVDEKKFRLPHIGWNNVTYSASPLSKDVIAPDFYFVHSYIVVPKEAGFIIGTCEYGERFPAAIRKDNIFGVQFHPEKSQASGLQLLKNFVSLC